MRGRSSAADVRSTGHRDQPVASPPWGVLRRGAGELPRPRRPDRGLDPAALRARAAPVDSDLGSTFWSVRSCAPRGADETSPLPQGGRRNELAFCRILSSKHPRLTIKGVTASETLKQEAEADSPGSGSALTATSGGTFGRLLRFAMANIRRRPERFILAVLGIALAIAAVTVVRTISASFAITGAGSVTNAIGTHAIWVVPAQGGTYDSSASALVSDGPPSGITLPGGGTGAGMIAGLWNSPRGQVAVYGVQGTSPGKAVAGAQLAQRLGVADGGTLSLAG